MLRLLVLACLIVSAESNVDFTYSTILDEFDLNSNQEIKLDVCSNGGCSIYVSVAPNDREATRNLFVYSPQGTNTSLYNIATVYDPNFNTKTGLHLSNTIYSIINYNTNNVIKNIVVYVISSQAPLYADDRVEFFDAFNMQRLPTNKPYTVIMSYKPYNLFMQPYGVPDLNAWVRATGPDQNYQRASPDDCQILYDDPNQRPFRLRITSPIITIAAQSTSITQICADVTDPYNGASLTYSGIATSQGYIGCAKNNFQTYRSSSYSAQYSFEVMDSAKTVRDVQLTYSINTHNTDALKLTFDDGTQPKVETYTGIGTAQPTKIQRSAYKIDIDMPSTYGSSFFVSYKPLNGAMSFPSSDGICAAPPVDPTPTAPAPIPTTSVASSTISLASMIAALAFRFL